MTEAQHQKAVFDWSLSVRGKFPELALIYHIPNGGKRNQIEARHLKAQGVKRGVPDICLPVPSGRYHGLYIEMKTPTGKPSPEQRWWIERLNRNGYRAVVCYGYKQAILAITDYLEGKV